jgi:hypothetical protein
MPTPTPNSPDQIPQPAKPRPPFFPINSIVRNILLTSPYFPRLYADVVISSAPNSNEAKILARNYQKIVDMTNMAMANAEPANTDFERTNKTNMAIHHNVKVCTHIKVTGVRCGSPALRGEQFCYFHQRMIRGVQIPTNARLHPVALIENEEAIQASLMEVINALARNTIDLKRAELILRALHIATKNARRVNFPLHASEMVKQVPDFAPAPTTAQSAEVKPVELKPAEAGTAHVGTDAFVRPAGPELSGRSAVDRKPPAPTPETSSAPDPTQHKPPRGVKEAPAAKQRKIAAHGASRG